MIFIYTAGILYLFYNFEKLVKTMEKELVVLRKTKQRSGVNRSQQAIDVTMNGERSTRHHGRRSGATQASEAVDNNDFRHPWYSKCRRPYFWISIGILAAIITDAIFETIMG